MAEYRTIGRYAPRDNDSRRVNMMIPGPQPQSTPPQYFRESCLADRGYRFVRWEGACTVWQFRGFILLKTVKVTPAGDVIECSEDPT